MDIDLFNEMGKEWKRRFEGKNITKILTIEASGIGIAICSVCGASEEVIIPEKSGLPGWSVVLISVGSTAAVGAGGFSLLWFVIKKKKWSDLIRAFKK